MVRAVAVSLLLSVLAAACGPAPPPDPASEPGPGLVVAEVRAGYPGARAGLAPGDRILGWGPAPGEPLPDPARWALLEAEEGTLGPVPLQIERDGRALDLEIPPSPWGVVVAPSLSPAVRDAVAALPAPEAVEQLRGAAPSLPPPIAAWLHLEIAGAAEPGSAERTAALDQAVAAAERDGESVTSGWAWWRRCIVLWRANDHPAAQAACRRAAERLEDRPLAAALVRQRLGISLFNSGQQPAAEAEAMRAAEEIRRVAASSTGLARALSLAAQCQRNRGALDASEESFLEARRILAAIAPEQPEAIQIEYQLGLLAATRGDLFGAERGYRTAAERYAAAGIVDRDSASALMSSGTLASMRGDLAAAETAVRGALAVFERDAPGSPHHIWALRALGDLHLRRGRRATAREIFGHALELARGLGETPTQAEVLWNLAELAEAEDRPDLACEHYRRAIEIFDRTLPGSNVAARLRTELGRTELERGDLDAARGILEEAAARHRRSEPGGLFDGWTSVQRARLAIEDGRPAEALELVRPALGWFRRLAPDTAVEADGLHAFGLALRDLGRTDEALAAFEAAVAALERQLPRLGSPEVGALERARRRALYDDYLQLLVDSGRDDQAFQLLERSRARAILALLAERDLAFRSALPAELDRERRLARAAHAEALERLGSLSDRSAAGEVADATRQLDLARERQQQVRLAIRAASPRLAGLAYPEPLDRAVAGDALDRGTVALSYHVGAERLVIFALTWEGALEVATVPIGGDELAAEIGAYRLLLQTRQQGARLAARGRRLAAALLEPVASEIARADRLLIVADGPLHLLPFGALPAPAAGSGGIGPLAAQRPIHLADSVTLFHQLAGWRDRAVDPGAPLLAAFGDPGPGSASAARLGSDSPAGGRLAGARREAESIAGLFDGSARLFLGDAASEQRARQIDPATRYVHFATHAVLDERFPLDSGLVLAAGDRDAGTDGLLQAWEIFENLVLTSDLVTLSACESALGEELPGEGLIGLTRAFHYAGARSVLASLWPVSDRSTAALMREVYVGLRSGLSKDEALRRAQQRLLSAPLAPPPPGPWARLTGPLVRLAGRGDAPESLDASHPYYWAAFQLYGDWR